MPGRRLLRPARTANERVLGFFDSGLGGLTVVRRVREVLPLHDMVFFADQAHVPYGDRSAEDLLRLVQQNLHRLDAEGAQAVIMACNTTCATASQFGWPPAHAIIVDLIESAAMAVEAGGYQRIGVIATEATARSAAYAHRIHARVPSAQVFEVAAPALVPLVEAGQFHGAQTARAVAQACSLLPQVDALLLGCTHYPLLFEHFRASLPGVPVIDPAFVHAQRAAELVERMQIPAATGVLTCITSGDEQRFRSSVCALAGDLQPIVRPLELRCPVQS